MILVSVAGDFYSSVLPVFYHLRAEISTHVLLFDATKDEKLIAAKIERGMEKFVRNQHLDILLERHPLNQDIQELIRGLSSYNPSELIINITDGLASVGALLLHHLLAKGVRFIAYDRYTNTYQLITQEQTTTIKINGSIPIGEHFELRGMEVSATSSKTFADKYEAEIVSLFDEHYELFNRFVSNNTYRGKQNPKPVIKILERMGLYRPKEFASIRGKLYEYYIYNLLKRLTFDEIEIGLKVKDYVERGFKEYVENEFDILIMKDNHLNMVECKFSLAATEGINQTHLVYKYIALAEAIDDDGKIFIVTKKGVYDDEKSPYTHDSKVIRRAKYHDIWLRGLPIGRKGEFQADVARHFGL